MKFRTDLGGGQSLRTPQTLCTLPLLTPDNYMTVCTPFFAQSATEAYALPPSSLLQPPLPPHP